MSAPPPAGPGPRSTVLDAASALGYLALAALGVAIVAYSPGGRLRDGVGLFAALLVVIALAGLAMVGHRWWFARHRPGVRLGRAPSGDPAVVVPRSRFQLVMSLAVTGTLVVVFAAAAAGLAGDHARWAVACGLVAAVLVWPLVPAARGRVRVGGLYLTARGVEHERDVVSWAVRWDQLAGATAREPLALVLQPGEQITTSRRARVVWDREMAAPTGTVGVDCRALGLDAAHVGAAVNTALAFPARRAELGTPAALAWDALR